MSKKLISITAILVVVFTFALAGCGTSTSLKNASVNGDYSKADLNKFSDITKGFAGDNFNYKNETASSYDKWLGYMTNDLKSKMSKTVPDRIKSDKESELIENVKEVKINSIKKQKIDNKSSVAVVNFDVYQNIKNNKDKTKIGKTYKINGEITLIKVANDYKIGAFKYGNAVESK